MDGDHEAARLTKSSRRDSLLLGYAPDQLEVQVQTASEKARRASDDHNASERSHLIIKHPLTGNFF